MAASLSIFLDFLIFSTISGCISAETSRKELRTKLVMEDIFKPSLPITIVRPSQVTQLSWHPRVFLYRDFLSEEEADHLISLVHDKRGDSITKDGLEKVDPAKLLSNLVMHLNKEDEVVARIEERISAWIFIPRENSLPLQVRHFRDEDSQQKYNYLGNKSTTVPEEPLMATVVLYLSSVSRGGEILFPESKDKILSACSKNGNALRPTKGNAIVFFNAHLSGAPDKSSSHARCPVLEGEMWCATKLFHLRSIKTENIQEFDDTVCTDEDENCPRWAAVGECQRNPVFMVGSPDYYGTCRKSCNSC